MNRALQKEQRISRILDTAEEAIVNNGLFSLSLLELARQSGCSVNTLYNYFANREDVAIGLFNRVIAKWGIMASELSIEGAGSAPQRYAAIQLIWLYRNERAVDEAGSQFLAALPSVWQHASHQRIATTRALLAHWYHLNCQFLMQSRDREELNATDEEIMLSVNLVTCAERGMSLFGNNHTFRDQIAQLTWAQTFSYMLPTLNQPQWQHPLTQEDLQPILEICDRIYKKLEEETSNFHQVDALVSQFESQLKSGERKSGLR